MIKFLLLLIIIVALLTYYQIDLRQILSDYWQKFAAWLNEVLD